MKNNVYPCKPQFYYIKVVFKGVKIVAACFRDEKRIMTKERPHMNPKTPKQRRTSFGHITDRHSIER